MADKFLMIGLSGNLPATRASDKLYWCSNTRELYLGMDLYTEAVRVVATLPTTPAIGVLYILPTADVWKYNGTEWTRFAYPYITSGVIDENSGYDKVPTAKVVYDSIIAAIGDATYGGTVINNITSTKAGTITIITGENSTDVPINGALITPSYNASTRTITFTRADGATPLEIALGKDIFIDSTAANKYNAATGKIELYLNDADGSTPATKIEIPASSLIDVYTGKTSTTATVNVNASNEISVDVKISAISGNKLVVAADGLKVDVSDKADASTLTALAGTVSANKSAADSAISALQTAINKLNADSNTAGSVANSIVVAKSEINLSIGNLQTAIDNINNATTGILAQAKTYVDNSLEWGTF